MQINVRGHCEPCASAPAEEQARIAPGRLVLSRFHYQAVPQALGFNFWQIKLASHVLGHQVPASPFTLQELAALCQGLLAEEPRRSLHDLPLVQGQLVKGVLGQGKAVLGHQLSIAQLPVRVEDLLARLQGPGCNDLHTETVHCRD